MGTERPDLTWDEVHPRVVALMRVDELTNLISIAREYAMVALVMACASIGWWAWSHGLIATPLFAVNAACAMLLIGALQHRISGLAHEASHGMLFRDPLVNELASDLLLMFPLLAFTQTYRGAHLGHHRWVNDPARDPDLLRLNAAAPQRFPISKTRFVWRYLLAALWPPRILAYLFGRAKAANVRTREVLELRAVYGFRVARCLRGAYWLSLLALVHSLHAWPVFWLFWVAPLLTFYPLLMQLREIAHHSNAPDDGDLTNSRVFLVHGITAWFVFPYGQRFHLTHHLFARVPCHKLARAHEILKQHRPYRESVVVCAGYFLKPAGSAQPTVLDVLAAPQPGRPTREAPRIARPWLFRQSRGARSRGDAN